MDPALTTDLEKDLIVQFARGGIKVNLFIDMIFDVNRNYKFKSEQNKSKNNVSL